MTFEEAIFLGLAPDGGLYVPEDIPQFTRDELEAIPKMSLYDIASLVLHKWLSDELTKAEIERVVQAAISFPLPLVEVGGYKVYELFHGPTLSIKDIPTRILTRMLDLYNKKRRRLRTNILMSTKDDTGAAVTNGFSELEGGKLIVVFPQINFNKFNREMLSRIGKNVLAVEVRGDYEVCKKLVKQAFEDPDLQSLELTSVNSISVGRIIPQIIYYVYLYALMFPNISTLVMPADDLGNACTVLLTQRMGIPFEKIILATNDNEYVSRYVRDGANLIGRFDQHKHASLYGRKMPKNFPRLVHLCGYSHKRFIELFEVYNVSLVRASHLMHAIWNEFHYLIDPYSSLAWLAADSIDHRNRHVVITATASPLKHADDIYKNVGIRVDDRHIYSELSKRKMKVVSIPSDYEFLKNLLLREFEIST